MKTTFKTILAASLLANCSVLPTQDLLYAIKATSLSDQEQLAKVKAALQKSANKNATDPEGNNAFHLAAKHGKPLILWELIYPGIQTGTMKFTITKDPEALFDTPNTQGETPLHLACRAGNLQIVEILLNAGANLESKSSITGATPLLVAIAENHPDIAKLLIGKGANVNATNIARGTALHIAAFNHQASLVQLLIAHGAKVDAKTEDGKTPLDSVNKVLAQYPRSAPEFAETIALLESAMSKPSTSKKVRPASPHALNNLSRALQDVART